MQRLRRLAEKLSRDRVVRRRFGAEFGKQVLFVTPDSALRYWRWNLESVDPDLLTATRRLVRAGSSVWDIGANCGLFAFSAAHLAGPRGQVVAVEPDAFLASNLRRSNSARAPTSAEVVVLPCAVSDSIGVAALHIASRGRSSNSLGAGRSQTGGFRATQATVMVTLDWLAQRYRVPDVVKIDVEGLELEVLRGGSALLSEARPTLYVEVGRSQAPEIARLLSGFGYELFDLLDLDAQVDTLPFNTVAIHPSRRR